MKTPTLDTVRVSIHFSKKDLETKVNIYELIKTKLEKALRTQGITPTALITTAMAITVQDTNGNGYYSILSPSLREYIQVYNRYLNGHVYCRTKKGSFWISLHKNSIIN